MIGFELPLNLFVKLPEAKLLPIILKVCRLQAFFIKSLVIYKTI